jgi:hypothetical protein
MLNRDRNWVYYEKQSLYKPEQGSGRLRLVDFNTIGT